ncbi:hypothetical protein [Hoeflea sp. BAL378]|uniref:hypothetical protein n=1 Tax=Hoeflea sp. BAL378 TaxID=1547437 RepID=UPI001269A78F|nr:hypothetical protein [Hoeflea sp. BAL378]|tara:strand:+ start:19744 stop:20178 length:435 start_codon:yes stop_codon:yes gene_type:complete
MTTNTATIIAFPTDHKPIRAKALRSRVQDHPTVRSAAPAPSASQGVSQGQAEACSSGLPPRTPEEQARHVAAVVRIAIRSAKRRGVRLESVLSIPRGWLLDLCDQGDPTCIVVRDWLQGNRKHLPKELEVAATGWTSGSWGDAS